MQIYDCLCDECKRKVKLIIKNDIYMSCRDLGKGMPKLSPQVPCTFKDGCWVKKEVKDADI